MDWCSVQISWSVEVEKDPWVLGGKDSGMEGFVVEEKYLCM